MPDDQVQMHTAPGCVPGAHGEVDRVRAINPSVDAYMRREMGSSMSLSDAVLLGEAKHLKEVNADLLTALREARDHINSEVQNRTVDGYTVAYLCQMLGRINAALAKVETP